MIKRDKRIYLLFAAIFLTITVLSLLTPMLADDYSYKFSYVDRSRIASIGDIFSSLEAHRVSMNGRMTAHFFAHLFLLLPKGIFCVANGLVCTAIFALLLGFSETETENGNTRVLLLLFLMFSVWIFTPVYGQVYLWLDGACNYSWSCCACLAFLLPFFKAYCYPKRAAEGSTFSKVMYCLVALIAGSYSEGASFGIIAAAFCFGVCIVAEKRKLPRILIAAFVCACVGYLLLMTAPSEWSGRTGSFDMLTVAKNIKRVITAPWESFPALFCIYAGLMALCVCCRVNRRVIVSSVVLFIGAWASLILFAAALYFPWRSLAPMVLLLSAACALMLGALSEKVKYVLPVMTAVLCAVFVFEFAAGVGDTAFVYYQYRQREAIISESLDMGETEAYLPVYEADTKYSGAYLLADVYEDADSWPNYDLAQYYGLERVYGIQSSDDTGNS